MYLETTRLYLRSFILEDAENIFELDSDADVMKYLTNGKPTPIKECLEITKRLVDYNKKFDGRLGYWAAMDKESNEFIGWFHLRPSHKDQEDISKLEIGYRLKKKFWRQGISTQISKALISQAFAMPETKEVFAITIFSNHASRRVMEKIGLNFKFEFKDDTFEEGLKNQVHYSLTRSEFEHLSNS